MGYALAMLLSWSVWAWAFTAVGIQVSIAETLVYVGLAPANGLKNFWFYAVTCAVAFYGAAFIQTKAVEEENSGRH